MNIILFGDDHWFDLLPLTFTRPIAEIRIGILTIKEKWEKHLSGTASYITQDYLSQKFPINIAKENVLINSTFLPNNTLVSKVKSLQLNQALLLGDEMIAAKVSDQQLEELNANPESFKSLECEYIDESLVCHRVKAPQHIFSLNSEEIHFDFELVTKDRKSMVPSNSNQIFGKHPVFMEEGVKMECCTINTNDGPVYIGKNVEVMEGSMLRGPIAFCEGVIVKMGAKIYGGTTAGPHCRLGGEIKTCVFFGNSNKGHDGFLGDSVIGEWCNLGADTNNSNLKNNYQNVKLWSYPKQKFVDTNLQFCGLIMGDHSKCGINTMFNTGTSVGVACNIFGDGYPRNFVPSFSWGGASGFIEHKLDKVIETAEIVMERRHQTLTDVDKNILRHIYQQTIQP